jgi:hypothetical protein
MADLPFPLIPSEEGLTADQDVEAAAAAALAPAEEAAEEAPIPYGRSWAFDFVNRRMVRRGDAPARVQDTDALIQWCLMAIYSVRYAHAVFSDNFGIEQPYDLLGLADPTPFVLDFENRLRAALTVHDRIVDIQNYEAEYDPAQGVLTIKHFDVVTDEEGVVIPVGGVALTPVD